jgi:uncharacterized protein (TIGR02594 family)
MNILNRRPIAIFVFIFIIFFSNQNKTTAQGCVHSVSSTSVNLDPMGDNVAVYLTTEECEYYTAYSNDSWIYIWLDYYEQMVSICADANHEGGRSGTVVIDNYDSENDFYISVYQDLGCSQLPSPGDITGTSEVCYGNSASFSISPIEGASFYHWTLNGIPVDGEYGTTATITFYYNVYSSPATITVCGYNECEQGLSSTKSITINFASGSATSVGISQDNVCPGTGVTLTANGGSLGAGASWKWYSGSCAGTYVGTGSSITVYPSTTTTYYVRAEGTCNNTSCTSGTVTVKTTSTAPSSVSLSDNNVCPGTNITLTVNGGSLGSGASWKWYSGSCAGTYVGTGTSIGVSPSTTTTYYVRAEGDCNNTTCASGTLTVKSTSTTPSSINFSNNNVCPGTNVTLTFSGGSLGTGAVWKWYSGSCAGTYVGTGSSISVNPSSTTTYYVRAEGDCNNTTCASGTLTVFLDLSGGVISGNNTSCYGYVAGNITSTSGANYGSGSYTYSWEKSTNGGVSWVSAGGNTTEIDPYILTITTIYRRKVTDNTCGSTAYSNTITKTVRNQLTAGSISGNQTLCYNDDYSSITGNPATGGSNQYTYHWEFSTSGGYSWDTISLNSTGMDLYHLTTTTSYRRIVIDNLCGSETSNTITKTVLPTLSPGSIGQDQTINFNETPSTLTSIDTASGGLRPYSYQWQSSPNGTGSWNNIQNATGSTYSTGTLTSTIFLRRLVSDNGICGTANSNTVKLTVAFPDADYLSGEEIIDPLSRTLNTSLQVGSLPGEFNVNNIGAATYQVPVFVSPGTAGMQPQISIVYNSQAKDGLLGKGWDLAGLSTIQRVPQNFYHEQKIVGINLQSTDKFALDSNRLILTSGTYGADGSVYSTEIETFVKVTAHVSGSNGPDWFEVETKDGKTLQYGNTASSRVEADGSPLAYLWRLNRVTDKNGNYMDFTYFENHGESYIETIKYTGNTAQSLTPYNTIKFTYTSKTDKNATYVGGTKVANTAILTSIRMETENDALVREYKFNYVQDFYTHLKEIVEYGSDNTYFNSTLIGWGSSTDKFSSNNSVSNSTKKTYAFGDFDGDGRTDYVVTEKKTSFTSSDKWELFLANNDGISFTKKNEGYLSSIFKGFYVADVDGNGKDEIFWRDVYTTGLFFLIYCYDPSVGLVRGNSNYDMFLSGADPVVYFLSGDFDGNGKQDYLFLYPNNSFYAVRVDGSGKTGMSFSSPTEVKIIDFDGDGRKEIFIATGGTSYIYQYNAGTQMFSAIHTLNSFSSVTGRIFPGDFNGDGKTDFLAYNNGWSLKFCTGTGFITCSNTPSLINTDPAASLNNNNYYIGDFNGDGKDDILEAFINGTGSRLDVYYSKGDGIFEKDTNSFSKSSIVQDYLNVGDFNGDGKKDIFYYNNSTESSQVNICFFHKDELKHFVSAITNGLNYKIQITYDRLNSGSSFYSPGNSATFPVYDYNGAYYAVSAVHTDNGLGSSNPCVYVWESAKIHRQGKGLLGFAKTTQTDDYRKFQSIKIFEQNPQFYYLTLRKKIDKMATPYVDTLNIVTNTNDVKDFGSNRIFPYTAQSISANLQLKTTFTTSFDFDNYGNNIKTKTIYSNDESGYGIEAIKSSTNRYQQFGNYGIPNKLIKTTDSSTYTNEPAYVRVSTFTYNTNDGNLLTVTSDSSKTKAVTTTLSSFNGFGLPLQTTISASGLTARSSTVEYDTKGRFITKITDPSGAYSTKTYYPGTGNVITETGIDGLTATYSYDGFGRCIETVTPQSNHIYASYQWESYTSLYSILTHATGKPYVKSFYDLLGREVRSETETPGGVVHQDKGYNSAGRLASQSWPYIEYTDDLKRTYFIYDEFGRLKKDTTSGSYTNYVYNSKITESRKWIGGNGFYVKSTNKNSLGNVIESIDGTSTVNTTYYSNGQAKQMNAEGTIVSFYYDEYGRQDSTINPNSGRTRYVYNAFGQLESQTDANNHTTSFQYDVLGRVTSKTNPEGTTGYSYISSGNGKGQIQTITGPGSSAITQSYTYDSYGRPTELTENIPGDQSFTTTFGYDNWNNNTSVTYPSGVSLLNVYSNGYLNEIKKSDGTSIWKLDSINEIGQPVLFSLGTNSPVSTKFDYDKYGNMINKKYFPQNNQSYTFDTIRGNMLSREYQTTGTGGLKTETFGYDSSNRLTSDTISSLPKMYVTYDTLGNIRSKTVIGNYIYDPSNPNKLDSISFRNSAISSLTQDILYNSDNLAVKIIQRRDTLRFIYGPSGQRIKTILRDSANFLKTKYFSLNYEKVIDSSGTRQLHYIYSPYGLIAVIIKKGSTETLYYTETDHLGSIIGLFNPGNAYAEKYSYDAWGRRRNPTNWSYDSIPAPTLIDRGFTGHEHLDKFDLINMNGRLYDPVIGRFLNVDPVIQFPGNAQSFNGYGYCLNNPLKYSDPSGMLACSLEFDNSLFDMSHQVWNSMPEFGLVNLPWSFDRGVGGGGNPFDAMNLLWYTQYGGNWSSSSGIHEYESNAESFFAGAIQIMESNSWGITARLGGATSFINACSRYSKEIQDQKLVASLTGSVDLENTTPWMDVAIAEIGQQEQCIADPYDPTSLIINLRVQNYFTDGGFSGDPVTTPWCAIFVNYCLQNAGIKGTNNPGVNSFLSWGSSIDKPVFGAIAVYKDRHVGFVVSNNGETIYLLGGNQSDMVYINHSSTWSTKRVNSYRYPSMYSPSPVGR